MTILKLPVVLPWVHINGQGGGTMSTLNVYFQRLN